MEERSQQQEGAQQQHQQSGALTPGQCQRPGSSNDSDLSRKLATGQNQFPRDGSGSPNGDAPRGGEEEQNFTQSRFPQDGFGGPGESGGGEEEQDFAQSRFPQDGFGGPGVEERKPRIMRAPFQVSKEEREAHEATHTPYRAWCPYCVRARGRNSPHRSREDSAKAEGIPKVSMDYFFMSNADESAHENPLFIMIDEATGERYARMAGTKGCTTGSLRTPRRS